MAMDEHSVFHVHQSNQNTLPTRDGLMGRRPEFRSDFRNRASTVRKWQCINSGYMVFILIVSVIVVGYSVYQMLIVELFDKLLDSLDFTKHIELSRELPPLSLICDQMLFAVGVISCISVISSGVLGTHKKKRTCTIVGALVMFLLAALSLSIGVVLYLSLDKFLSLFPISDPLEYGILANSTRILDHHQSKLSCCGRNSFSDYKYSPCFSPETTTPASNVTCMSVLPLSVVPATCCKNANDSHCNHGQESGRPDVLSHIHQKGCLTVIKEVVYGRFKTVTALLFSYAIVVFIGLPNICCLYVAITKEKSLEKLQEGISRARAGGHRCHNNSDCTSRHCSHGIPIPPTPHPPLIHGQSHPALRHSTPLHPHTASYNKGELYHHPNKNFMSSARPQSNSTINIPVSAILDPDTEMSDGESVPFDQLVVVPIQTRRHKHRVQSASLIRNRYSALPVELTEEQPGGYSPNLYRLPRGESTGAISYSYGRSCKNSWDQDSLSSSVSSQDTATLSTIRPKRRARRNRPRGKRRRGIRRSRSGLIRRRRGHFNRYRQ